ncbi:putative galactose oxidase/kelch, beta-propeller, galactose oxidase, beta-propeller [Rosa chinensis]|uniref:Putative galactose oxidase/kelch, beta-propeller, galactose oxidase, beta-propeller n=2 Tax=Rosa chinensis TaxID=74649 RepID=A0A2P6RM39_ROSCH|nr:putative galactose oxidase/kelch, beta-propeller, galactose oxidase, beta-propeller [Rosa chinensis]
MDDQIRSVYLTLHYSDTNGVGGLLHEIQIRKDGKVITKSTEDKPEPPSRKLFDETEISWVPLVFCERIASKLYILAGERYRAAEAGAKVAYIFDPKASGDLVKFNRPYIFATFPNIIAAHGRLYHLATLLAHKPCVPMPFELYDPTTNSWDPLTPVPHFAFIPQSSLARRELTGYAVWGSCILLSLWYPSMKFKPAHFVPVVFNAELGTWHQVNFNQKQRIQRFPFRGKAAVVGDTIYAFGVNQGKFISFSIKKSGSEEDGTLIYSLTTPYELEGLKIIQSAKYRYYSSITECWAPLGYLDFCLVQTMSYGANRYQPLFITTFKIIHKEGWKSHIETIHSTLQFVSSKGYGQFWIIFGYRP